MPEKLQKTRYIAHYNYTHSQAFFTIELGESGKEATILLCVSDNSSSICNTKHNQDNDCKHHLFLTVMKTTCITYFCSEFLKTRRKYNRVPLLLILCNPSLICENPTHAFLRCHPTLWNRENMQHVTTNDYIQANLLPPEGMLSYTSSPSMTALHL